jgi:hypothetical protein
VLAGEWVCAPTGVVAVAVVRDLHESGSVRVGYVDIACRRRVGREHEFPATGRPLLRLAADEAPPGAHLHVDDLNGLEPGSVEIILERT